jgi:hypothetical protein
MRSHLVRENTYDHYEEPDHRIGIVAMVARVFDFLFGLLYALFIVRFLLVFFNARADAGFFQFIHSTTEAFYRPFEGLFATTYVAGGRFEWPLLVAIVAYALLHAGIRGILRLIARA